MKLVQHGEHNFMFTGVKFLVSITLCISLMLCISAPALAQQCPFTLRGAQINEPWSKVTNNQWSNMLSAQWVDKGFHFYSQIRSRGPAAGIKTPSDLESEIRSGKDKKAATAANPNRYNIILNIVNGSGRNAVVVYDYVEKVCQLVTFTY